MDESSLGLMGNELTDSDRTKKYKHTKGLTTRAWMWRIRSSRFKKCWRQ
jgi:hypothetical protein